jgi:hypothetical protein
MGRASAHSQVRSTNAFATRDNEEVLFVCPRCRATGPFEHLIEVTQAIEVVFTKNGARHRPVIVEDAVASEEEISEAGYRCGSCQARFDSPRWL